MTTATHSPTMRDLLSQRWTDDADEQGHHRNMIGDSGDALDDALRSMVAVLLDRYSIDASSSTTESLYLTAGWSDPIEKAAIDAGKVAWREHVEPVVLEVLAAGIAAAPEWIRVHPESEQLRADLALVPA